MSRYKIKILSLQGVTLHFTVSKFEISESGLINFIDEKTGRILTFSTSRCEIEEIKDE
jgi:hypothetical protein